MQEWTDFAALALGEAMIFGWLNAHVIAESDHHGQIVADQGLGLLENGGRRGPGNKRIGPFILQKVRQVWCYGSEDLVRNRHDALC